MRAARAWPEQRATRSSWRKERVLRLEHQCRSARPRITFGERTRATYVPTSYVHQNRYSMFLSSPAFHPTPLTKITPFPPFPPSPALACVQQFPQTGYLVCPQTAAPCALRANPSAGAMPALVDRRSTVAAKPPTPERRCDAANRPADARPGRPRAHRRAP